MSERMRIFIVTCCFLLGITLVTMAVIEEMSFYNVTYLILLVIYLVKYELIHFGF